MIRFDRTSIKPGLRILVSIASVCTHASKLSPRYRLHQRRCDSLLNKTTDAGSYLNTEFNGAKPFPVGTKG